MGSSVGGGRSGSVVIFTLIAGLGVVLGLSVVTAGGLSANWVVLVLVAVLVPLAAAVIGDVRKALLALILFEIPFQFDTHIFYREEPASLGAIGGLGVSVTSLAIALLYLLWMLDTVLQRDSARIRPTAVAARPALLYVGAAVLSLIVARDRQLSLFEIVLLVQTLLLFFYLAHWIRTRAQVLFAATFLVAGLAAESLVMVSIPFIGHTETALGVELLMWDSGRVGGTLGSPNHAAAYLAMLLPLAASLLLARSVGTRKVVSWIALLAGAVAIVLTQSRGGWTAIVIAALLLVVGALRRDWLSPPLALAVAGVGICAMILAQGPIVTRLTTPDSGAAYARYPLMVLAFRMIVANPILGVGANNFAVRIEDYATGWLSEEWLFTVHNKYLLVAAENGLPAMIFFVWFLVATIRRGLRVWRGEDSLLSPLALGMTAAIVGHLAHMTVDVFNDRSHIQTLWVYAAMLISMERMSHGDPDAHPGPRALPESG